MCFITITRLLITKHRTTFQTWTGLLSSFIWRHSIHYTWYRWKSLQMQEMNMIFLNTFFSWLNVINWCNHSMCVIGKPDHTSLQSEYNREVQSGSNSLSQNTSQRRLLLSFLNQQTRCRSFSTRRQLCQARSEPSRRENPWWSAAPATKSSRTSWRTGLPAWRWTSLHLGRNWRLWWTS